MADDITARARAALEGVTEGEWRHSADDDGYCWTVDANDRYVATSRRFEDARFIAAARWLMPELLAVLERKTRACKTLGEIVEGQCRMALDATGLHHLIDDDGDGDWGAVWENLAGLRAERDEARAEVERLRGALDRLATRWSDALAEDNTNGYGAAVEHCLDELRDVLRGDQ